MLVPVGRVELPFAFRADVGRCLQPALRRDDVVPAVAVKIADTDPVPVAFRADDVLGPLTCGQFEPGKRNIRPVKFREKFEGLPVVVEVDKKGELCRAARVDLRRFPIAS